MSIDYNALDVVVDLAAIRANYRLLSTKVPRLCPVVKSDAYGHGLVEVARALRAEGAREFCVGVTAEAVKLKRGGIPGDVYALLGLIDEDEAADCFEYDVIPVCHRLDQLETLAILSSGMGKPARVAVKFDCGMRRLGFRENEAAGLAMFLRDTPGLSLVAVMAHLACADNPAQADFTAEQAIRFGEVEAAFREVGLSPNFSLANSAAILSAPHLGLDFARPGVALYGANPFDGGELEDFGQGLRPAMSCSAPLLSVRDLDPGEPLGYGGLFRTHRPTRVGVAAAGYADCVSRGLSSSDGQGAAMLVRGERCFVLGRVSMQMTMIDVTNVPEARPGDRAYILGGEGQEAIRPEELAKWWGTIPYEVFCLLGLNRRRFIDSDSA